jgi:predicted nucleic acid-binding protein
MSCLIDTGILLRAFDASSADYGPVRQSLRELWKRQEVLITTIQNLAEFWNVSTRPIDRNGYGLSTDRTTQRLRLIERICQVVTEDQNTFRIWKGLLTTYTLTGVSVHDARLVSVMLSRGITDVLTLNGRDFRRYRGISVLMPNYP